MAQDDDIKNILDGEEIPFNPQHWEQLKARLDAAAPSPFEEKAKNILSDAEAAMPAGAWDQFESKLNNPSTPFEKAAKEKLESANVPYNSEHWNKIEAQLNNNRTSFEQKANEILNGNEAAYNAKHWTQMEAMLDAQNSDKGGFFTWKKVAAAAAVIFLSWATYALINNTADNNSAKKEDASSTISSVGSNSQQLENSEINRELNKNAAANSSYDNSILNGADKSDKDATIDAESIKKENSNSVAGANKKKGSKKHKNKSTSNNNNDLGEIVPVYLYDHLVEVGEEYFYTPHITVATKKTISANDALGSVVSAANAPDFNGQTFKYLSIPSYLTSSVLTNLWDNPAVAGLDKGTSVKVMYNTLWTDKMLRGLANKKMMLENPTNYYVSADAALGRRNQFAVGAYYHRNDNNNWQSNNVNVSVAYNKMISKFTLLKLGVGATYCNNAVITSNINFWEKSTAGGLLSAEDEAINAPERYLNYNAGMWLSHPLYFAGITLNNLAQNTFTKSPQLQIENNVIGGINLPFSKKTTATIYAQRQSSIIALWTAGAMMSFNNKVFAGISVENSNYAAFTLGMNIANRLRFHINGGMLAQQESLYLGTEKEGFIQGGIKYTISSNNKQIPLQ